MIIDRSTEYQIARRGSKLQGIRRIAIALQIIVNRLNAGAIVLNLWIVRAEIEKPNGISAEREHPGPRIKNDLVSAERCADILIRC
ncbi:MAG: hypothetical protein WCS70_11475 [Verrucomicrobiota bacterium]